MASVKHNRLKLTDVRVITSDIVITSSDFINTQRMRPSDASGNSFFGYSTAMNTSGTILAVGAPDNPNTGGFPEGAVHIFTKNSSDIWSERQKLKSSDISLQDRFGNSVCINSTGDTILVGARREGTGFFQAGAAYIFTKNSSDIWSEQQKIQASDRKSSGFFGTSVDIDSSGSLMAIGADNRGVGAGEVYIFTKNSSDIWNELQKIQASDAEIDDRFGSSVSINSIGNTLIVSSPTEDTGFYNSGAFYIFTKNSSDIWNELQKIQASDRGASQWFGTATSINYAGNIAVIGAANNNYGGSETGAAYIYTKNTSDVWSEQQRIIASDNQNNDHFGSSVSINSIGNLTVIGAPDEDTGGLGTGAAYIYIKNSSDVWNELQKTQASDNVTTGDRLGSSLTMNSTGELFCAGNSNSSAGRQKVSIFKAVSFSFSPIGGLTYSDIQQYEIYRMKSDTRLKIKL